MCWIAKHNYGIKFILHLLDDYLTIDSPSATAERTMALLTMIFNRLRVPIAPHKTVGPTVQLQYLDIILDTDSMEARLPLDKLTRIREMLHKFESKQRISKRALLSLLGHLNFASRVMRQGRSFMSYLLALAASVKELHHHVKLNAECRQDMAMWHRFHRGVSFTYFATEHSICPLQPMLALMQTLLAIAAQPHDPLFTTLAGTPLTLAFVIDKLKILLSELGYNPALYSGHSFRIGAATLLQLQQLTSQIT